MANAEAISAEDIGVSGCLGGRGYARAKLGQYDDAIADLTSSREMESRVGLAAGENALNTCVMQASILVRQGALRSAPELLVHGQPDGLAAPPNRWRTGEED